MIRRFLHAAVREPLIHFLFAGAAIFGLHAWVTRDAAPAADDPNRVVRVSAADVDWLRQGFAKQWRRSPTAQELQALVADLLREQLLAREAQALGLAEGDTIVRRRLAQKMLFVIEDAAQLGEPTDDELRQFYGAHASLFTSSPRLSFEQVYFSRDRRRDAAADARATLQGLTRGVLDPQRSGDRLLVDGVFAEVDEAVIANTFGQAFADEVFALAPSTWHGPVASGYGLHLVRVNRVDPGLPREFAKVKAEVLERWREQRRREGVDRYFAGLLSKYAVVVDASVQPLLGPQGIAALLPVSTHTGGSSR